MLYNLTVAFLGLSLALYCLLGGADFGAGILEIFSGKRKRQAQIDVITEAMGPVWEANHMWLILAVVILFVGFPQAYTEASIYLHVPITALLIGIILRGCAFTFRHYDAYQDKSQHIYSFAFAASSAFTPFAMGLIIGGLVLGRIDPASTDYYSAFVAPWWTSFGVALGLFMCSLFSFLAAVYLIDEASSQELKLLFASRARVANLACVLTGGLVFATAESNGYFLFARFTADPLAVSALVLATLSLMPLWRAIHMQRSLAARALAAFQVLLILGAFFHIQYPVFMATKEGPRLLSDLAAPEATLKMLALALLFGSCLLLPALAYLIYVFKRRRYAQ